MGPGPDRHRIDDDEELDPMLAELIRAMARDAVAEEMLIARRAREKADAKAQDEAA